MKLDASVDLPDNACAFASTADGDTVVVASLDGTLTALDRDARVRWQHRAHPGGALAVDVSPDGALVLSGGQDGAVVARALDDGAVRWSRAFPGAWSQVVRWSRDGARAGAATGRDARFFTRDGEAIGAAVSHASTVTALDEHATLGWLSSCYGGLQVLSPGRDRPTRRMPFRGSVVALAMSPDGRHLAGGSQDATVRLWDLATRQETSLTGYPGKVTALAWDRAGTWLATGGGSSVVLWRCDVPTVMGTVPLRLTAHTARVRGVAFSVDGTRLAAAGDDGVLAVWRVDLDEGPEVVATLRAPAGLRHLWRAGASDALWCADGEGRLHQTRFDAVM